MHGNTIPRLIANQPLISDQVSKHEIELILQNLEQSLQQTVQGDVVEFGCYVGTTSLYIQKFLSKQKDKIHFHVYDSFVGLPEKTTPDFSPAGEQFVPGSLSASKKQFVANFKKAGLKLPTIHKAWFEDLTPYDMPEQIAFAFLDGDYYVSIQTSLDLVTPRLIKGAIMVIDDYLSEALPGTQKAVDEWLLRHPNYTLATQEGLAIIRDGRVGRS